MRFDAVGGLQLPRAMLCSSASKEALRGRKWCQRWICSFFFFLNADPPARSDLRDLWSRWGSLGANAAVKAQACGCLLAVVYGLVLLSPGASPSLRSTAGMRERKRLSTRGIWPLPVGSRCPSSPLRSSLLSVLVSGHRPSPMACKVGK